MTLKEYDVSPELPLLSQIKCKCDNFQVDSYDKNKLDIQKYKCPHKLKICELYISKETEFKEVNKQK